jgi:hypothetical protein
MSSSPSFIPHALQYQDLLQEYCEISAKGTLTDWEADRIESILATATQDAMLSFLIDEADHILAHLHHLVAEDFIIKEQNKLKDALDNNWLNQLLLDIATCLQAPQRKTLQQYLKEKGFYVGSIDGIVGPKTQAALKHCSASGELSTPLLPIHGPEPDT